MTAAEHKRGDCCHVANGNGSAIVASRGGHSVALGRNGRYVIVRTALLVVGICHVEIVRSFQFNFELALHSQSALRK